MFHTMSSELLVVVDEGERKVDVEWVGSFGSGSSLPRLKSNHQVHPGGGPPYLKLIDEILSKDLTQQLLKFIVDPNRSVGATWERKGRD